MARRAAAAEGGPGPPGEMGVVGTVMETTSVITKVIGAERGESPEGVVRVALERQPEGELLLQLSEEAATQLLAHLLRILPKRGWRT